MNIVLQRGPSVGGATIGTLTVNGRFECFTLEDIVRIPGVRVRGRTAIPPGRYKVDVTPSARFSRDLPILRDVPLYSGIRIHGGNTSTDTEGCILVGNGRGNNYLTGSQLALAMLMDRLGAIKKGEQVWIDVRNPIPVEGDRA